VKGTREAKESKRTLKSKKRTGERPLKDVMQNQAVIIAGRNKLGGSRGLEENEGFTKRLPARLKTKLRNNLCRESKSQENHKEKVEPKKKEKEGRGVLNLGKSKLSHQLATINRGPAKRRQK